MRKLYFLFIVLLSGLFLQGQNVNLSDTNFKTRLLAANENNTVAKNLSGEWFKIDSNNDGKIQIFEAEEVTYLNVSNADISDLTGIESFISLKELNCLRNQITNLEITTLLKLVTLDCRYNPISSLDFSNLVNIKKINCSQTQLSYLNLKNNNPSWIELQLENTPNLEYICANQEDITWIQDRLNQFGYTNCNVNSYCNFTPGGQFYQITGNIKFDSNNDGCDVSDVNFSNLNFSISNGNELGNFIANQSGNYAISVDEGSYTITPTLENPSYFTITPNQILVDFPTMSSPVMKDFCVTANGIHSDVEVYVLPLDAARPGFEARYKIVFRNRGTEVESGNVSFTHNNTVTTFDSSLPSYGNQSTNGYEWSYSDLQPFETREITIVLKVNSPSAIPSVNIDDELSYTAVITSNNVDETPNNNTFTLDQTVVGSYDPNDITCLEGETVSPEVVGKYVHYMIRFENMGTFAAENVVVKDLIDAQKFDISTLVPLDASHDYYTSIENDNVEFIFENIDLDYNDTSNDGYISFKIKTRSDLGVGETFSNEADIYFDFNFPVNTNKYTTTIEALKSESFEFSNYFTLYPNPTKNTISLDSKVNIEVTSIEIYNIVGQLVISVTNDTNTIDVSRLTKGNYFVKIQTENGTTNTKFIKE